MRAYGREVARDEGKGARKKIGTALAAKNAKGAKIYFYLIHNILPCKLNKLFCLRVICVIRG